MSGSHGQTAAPHLHATHNLNGLLQLHPLHLHPQKK